MVNPEVVVALNGPTIEGKITPDTISRVETAMKFAIANHIGHVAMIGGSTTSMQMREHALRTFDDELQILTDNNSNDTIGNALYAKLNILCPNNWSNLVVATADYHVRRARWTFARVLGPDYEIGTIGAETDYSVGQKIGLKASEVKNWAFTQLLLKGLKPEQDDELDDRLKLYHPRYGGGISVRSALSLVIGHQKST